MPLIPSSDANISQLVTTPKNHVYVHYTSTLLRILTQISPGHAEPLYSIPYTTRSSMWPSPLCFPIKNVMPLYYPLLVISAHFIPSSPITLVLFGV